jgi:hypothetical protein
MKSILAAAAATLLAVHALPAPAAGDGSTARGAVKVATAAAKNWQSDAVLTSVSTLEASPDGKSAKWAHLYYSIKTKKGYLVDVAGGKVVTATEVRPHVTDAVETAFIDSDRAMAVAKANGVETKGRPYSMALRLTGKNTKKPITAWLVGGGFSKGAVAVAVDAKTGKFEFRQEIP